MKKKVYQTPTMQVVKLQHQQHLLQASVEIEEVDATMDGVWQEEDI